MKPEPSPAPASEASGKPTPGPWKASRLIVHDASGNGIAKVTQRGNEPGHITGEGTANARLIAAAPELLEALQKITDHLAAILDGPMIAGRGVKFQNGVEGVPTIAAARAAIAKATGATP